ncbi:MAG TPA: hypothetical protein VFV87_00215 [Pirellulaceae bacterium]|nr:hypothetical protein [Pirellulaceae bacterium]
MNDHSFLLLWDLLMSTYRCASLSFAHLFLGLVLAAPAAAQFEALAAKVPSTANAIVLLDGQKVMSSPLAEKEGWKEKYEAAFASGVVTIAPDTRHMVLASQMDYQYMRPLWEVAIGDFADSRSVAEIARRTKGTIDSLGGLQAVALSDDSYAVEFSPTRLGVMAPGNRQTVSRWVSDVRDRDQPQLSPYLKGTLTASNTSQIVIAFDLQDAVPPHILRDKLAASSSLAGKMVDLDAAAAALASIRGLVLEVAITDGSYGRLMIHFGSDASVLAPYAKPILLEALGNMGAMIDDLAEWKVTTEPTRFTFQGMLSADGRKRVFSLIDHPIAALVASDASKDQSTMPEQSKMAQATLQYFRSIVELQDDLREKSKDAKTFGQNALWFDNWARKIDRLPILNVDPDMLAYGRYVSSRMRDISAALKGIGIQSAAKEAQVYQQFSTSASGYGGYWGGEYSYYTQWNNVGGQRRAISAQERAQGATTARTIAAEMENQMASVRQAMTQKYQINF